MDDQHRLTYLTRYYYELQGIRTAPVLSPPIRLAQTDLDYASHKQALLESLSWLWRLVFLLHYFLPFPWILALRVHACMDKSAV